MALETRRKARALSRAALLGVLVPLPAVAAAQETASPPRVAVGAGAGVAFPFHGDFDFTRTLQVNVLFSGATGRLRTGGGGGVGLLQHHRRSDQLTADCSPGVSCGAFESSFSNSTGTVQAAAGAEGRLAGGLALYGQVRFLVPMTDPGGSDLRVTTGARWGFGRGR